MKNLFPFFILIPVFLFGQNFDNGYNFFMPPFDSSAQKYLPVFPTEIITDFISVGSDGHFYSGNEQVRFWGINDVSGACFPEKTLIPGIAARMRKSGINIVRFHHMDNPWTGQDGVIFERNSGGTRTFNPTQVDKFQYFISELKRNGIYANINLLVSREFREADGISDADALWSGGRVVNLFDPQMIDLQKEYARNLLTKVNPYTGMALINDPVMAMVEIANENSIYAYWKNSYLTTQNNNGILLPRHDAMLDSLWNVFLQKKYTDQVELEQAWEQGGSSDGNDQVSDGGFESGDINTNWYLDLHDAADGIISTDDNNPYEGNYCGKVEITEATDTEWHTQFRQLGFDIKQGKTYKISFAAKADQPRVVTSYIMQDFDPWRWYSGQYYDITTDWQEYELIFTPFEDNNGRVRLGFMFDADTGTFWFDNIRLTEVGLTGIEQGEILSSGNIKRIRYRNLGQYTEARTSDLSEFYINLQKNYFDEMYRFLKNDLGVKVPVSGTNAHSGVPDIYTNSDLDYIDDHGYWDHPNYPDGWSINEWYIDNESMLENWHLGTISTLFSGMAIEGKPYTISEFRTPFPNRHETEMIPLITSYGLFHDLDGLMFFQYNESNWNWETDKIESWWSMHRNPALMSMMPVFGYVFQNGLITSSNRRVNLDYPKDYLTGISRFDRTGRWSSYLPFERRLALDTDIRISGFDSSNELNLDELPEENEADVIQTSTFETKFDAENNYVTTVTPQFVSVTGKLNSPFQVSADILQVTGASDWGTIAWLSLTDQPLKTSQRSLLTITSRAQNTNMNWTDNNNVNNEFGEAPTEMLSLATSLLIEIEADSIQLFPLSPIGAESNFTTHYPIAPNTFLIGIDQAETQTPWYGIEAFGKSVTTSVTEIEQSGIKIYPNPASEHALVVGTLPESTPLIFELINSSGKIIKNDSYENEPSGVFKKSINLSGITSGVYFLRIKYGGHIQIEKLIIK